ncbi:centrosomal protein of 19 kDa isoform X2 [Salarias fasciatus]|uniref:Centrosomal protein of 19 kDa n=1 Tax=Salarias fasciatus TaxID=181472 RepID=A0A672G0W3_SALFA|nr:centrosomal protein of 19 kDa isoform X2 [Salarias fasciatus]
MQLFFYLLLSLWMIPLWRRGSGTTDPALACSIPFQMNDYTVAAERLKNHPRHKDYLEGVSQNQLEKLHIILQDHLKGVSLKESLASFHLDPNQDLNKLDDEELARKKGQMDELFEKNRMHKDDPNFVYDLEVDFTKTTNEKCSWDEDSDDGF